MYEVEIGCSDGSPVKIDARAVINVIHFMDSVRVQLHHESPDKVRYGEEVVLDRQKALCPLKQREQVATLIANEKSKAHEEVTQPGVQSCCQTEFDAAAAPLPSIGKRIAARLRRLRGLRL